MSIPGISNYNSRSYYDSVKVNKTSKKENASQSSKTETSFTSRVKKTENSVESNDTQKYLADLQKKNLQINIMCGSKDIGQTKSSNSKTDVMIAPSILNQMASDPEAARKYEKMLADIPALDKWADSMIRSLTGSEVKYRQVWIDEDGNMGSFCITGPSESTKKAEKQEEYAKKVKEQREKQKELLERLENGNKNPAELAYAKSIFKLMPMDRKV